MEILLVLVALLVLGGVSLVFLARRQPARDEEAPPARRRRRGGRTREPISDADVVAEAEALLEEAARQAGDGRRPEEPTDAEPEPEAEADEHELPGGERPEEGEPPREVPEAELEPEAEPEPELERPRMRDRLGKARGLLSGYWSSVRSRQKVDASTWDDLEEALIRADVGMVTTTKLLESLRAQAATERIEDPDALLEALKSGLAKALAVADRSLHYEPGTTNLWLFVGVNGVGKTTTIGKVARWQSTDAGRSVLMAAGDTFRAAAAEQLEMWADRAGAEVVRGSEGGDPASVVFDAAERASARGIDLVLADTAGRLHTKVNLMEELAKVRRVAEKAPGQVTEVLLVIDATTGQNGLIQARQFAEAAQVTGVVLTKLDGTAKGGIALAIQTELGIPVKLVGLGEGAGDLVAFDPEEFVEALFD